MEILDSGDRESVRALFGFDSSDSDDEVIFKFKLWVAHFYPQYFKVEDAPFHDDIDRNNLNVFRGRIDSFVDGAFRGAAKTTRTKLFFAFWIANDTEHSRKYLKIATKDIANAKQIVTDIYNHLAVGPVKYYYPEIFQKTPEKKQETMGVFDTATGIKVKATTVGVEQRGQLQEDARPDVIWFDDFETRLTLRSAVTTQMLWDNMEEARTGLSEEPPGGCIYTCNYVSERGNVHKLITPREGRVVLLTPIITKEGVITWPARFTMQRIKRIEDSAEDYAGEYLNEPSAGADIYFDRSVLDRQDKPKVLKTLSNGNRKIFANYNPSHMYGTGSDVGGGIGLDHSADVTIDFSLLPARVVSTFKDNTLKPDVYGYEVMEQGRRFGECIVGVENNKFDTVIQVLRTNDYPNIYFTEDKVIRAGMPNKTRTYGWNTNGATKYTMMAELKSAVEDGHLQLSDPDLVAELRSYTRDDLMDKDDDVRLTTRHFDLLISCFVKDTLILTNAGQVPIQNIKIGDLVMTRKGYKKVIATRSDWKPVVTNLGLTGTANHPVICNDNEVKDLSEVSLGDNLYIWDSKLQKIERLSYTKALPIIATLMQQKETTESISAVGLSGKSQLLIYIDRFGLIILELFQKVFKFTIKMVTRLITLSKTWSAYQLQNIWHFICKSRSVKKPCEKILKRTEQKSQKLLTKQTKQEKKEISFVSGVVRLLSHFHTMLKRVQNNVHKDLMVKEEKNHQLKKSAAFVTSHSSLVYHIEKDVQSSVINLGEEKVYNIEVEDEPEYFANGVLVHNCAIAWQMRKYAEVAKPKEGGYQQPAYESPLLS